MTTQTAEAEAHTIAIGIGSYGCGIVSEIKKMVQEGGTGDRFQFIGIYRGENDIPAGIEGNNESVELNAPSINEEGVDFLDKETAERLGEKEATERSIGRAYIDSEENFVDVYKCLRDSIENAVDRYKFDLDEETPRYNIWIISSLGDMVGSGSFPMVGAVIDHLLSDIVPDVERNEVRIMGLGSLPWHKSDIEGYIPSKEVASSQVNAYTAIRDIRILTSTEKDHSVKVNSAKAHAEGIPSELGGSGVFDRYFIQPAEREKRDDPGFKDQLYRSASVVPLYISKLSSEEAESAFEADGSSVYSFRSLEIEGPQKDIKKYIELDWDDNDEKEAIEERLNDFRIRKKRRMPLPVRDPNSKLEDLKEELEDSGKEIELEELSLKSLFEDKELLNEEDILDSRNHALRRVLRDEPLADIDTGPGDEPSDKYVTFFGSKENIDVLREVGEGREYNISIQPYDEEIEVQLKENISTWLIGTYRGPDMDSVSEYKRINDRYIEEDRDLTELFSSVSDDKITDEYVTRRFAYPELYLKNEAIKSRMRENFW